MHNLHKVDPHCLVFATTLTAPASATTARLRTGSPAPLTCTRVRGTVTAQALLSASAVVPSTSALPIVTERAAIGSALGLRTVSSSGIALRLIEILPSLILINASSILLPDIWTVRIVRLVEVRARIVAGLRTAVL